MFDPAQLGDGAGQGLTMTAPCHATVDFSDHAHFK